MSVLENAGRTTPFPTPDAPIFRNSCRSDNKRSGFTFIDWGPFAILHDPELSIRFLSTRILLPIQKSELKIGSPNQALSAVSVHPSFMIRSLMSIRCCQAGLMALDLPKSPLSQVSSVIFNLSSPPQRRARARFSLASRCSLLGT